jgi:hypothetical protein
MGFNLPGPVAPGANGINLIVMRGKHYGVLLWVNLLDVWDSLTLQKPEHVLLQWLLVHLLSLLAELVTEFV